MLTLKQSDPLNRVSRTMDMLLKNDVPFEPIFDEMYPEGQKYIKAHSAYRRAKLTEIAQSTSHTRVLPKRPDM